MRSGAIDEDWAVVAIQSDRLAERALEVLDDPATSIGERERAERALAACHRIGDRVDNERDRILALLSDRGLAAEPLGQGGPRQNHTIRLGVDSYDAAQRVATALVADGFERWERWSAGAAESFRRFADHLTVAKHDDVSVIVRIVWAEPTTSTRPRSRGATEHCRLGNGRSPTPPVVGLLRPQTDPSRRRAAPPPKAVSRHDRSVPGDAGRVAGAVDRRSPDRRRRMRDRPRLWRRSTRRGGGGANRLPGDRR